MSRLPQATDDVQNAQSPSKIKIGSDGTLSGSGAYNGSETTGCASTIR